MNKSTISALLVGLMVLPVSAKEITPQEALLRVGLNSPARLVGQTGQAVAPVHTTLTSNGAPAVYVFNQPAGQGYFLLSADDSAVPVLGYADRGNFTADEMPPQMQWWLNEYARQIEYARENDLQPFSCQSQASFRSGQRDAITPQLNTFWDQVEPYNNLCPLSGTQRTWTGCVATAMAQVMNYWNYPEKGKGSITYTVESLEKKVSMNFESKKFDWDNMLDIYINGFYNDDEASAVAYLMKACGYSVKMQYSMDASGALGLNIGNALVKYFSYDPNVLYTLRQYYSSAQWDEMMYENLKNVGPVVYGGNSALGGGHSFVCDGYDGEGYYHFNWGWSGMSDGYFMLEALNPGALGAGGGTGGGYNFSQDAVFGIQPPTGEPAEERPVFLTQDGELSGDVSDSTLSLSLVNTERSMWINFNPSTLYVKFGAMFHPQGENAGLPIYCDISDRIVEMQPGYGTDVRVLKPSVDLSLLNLPDGIYKVVVGSVPVPKGNTSSSTDSEGFVEVKPGYGYNNYVTLKVENGEYSVSADLLAPLKVQGEIVGGLYYGALARVRVTVENPADVEQTSGFAPVFLDEVGPVLLGESVCLTIPPHTSMTREWDTELTQYVQFIDPYLEKELTFSFFNEVDYSFYTDIFSSKVVLHDNPGMPSLSMSAPLAIEGAYWDGNTNIIPDCTNINVSGELSITRGYFNYPVVVCLCREYMDNEVEIVCTGSQNLYLSADDPETRTGSFNVKMSYPSADPDKQYFIVLIFQRAGSLVQLANAPVKFINLASVTEVEGERKAVMTFDRSTSVVNITSASEISSIETYDVSGRNIGGVTVIDGTTATIKLAGKGMFIISVQDINGLTDIFKILN